MNTKIYIDKGAPVASVHAETLSDGSTAWNLYIGRGDAAEEIPCRSEKIADDALVYITKGIEIAIGERPLIL